MRPLGGILPMFPVLCVCFFLFLVPTKWQGHTGFVLGPGQHHAVFESRRKGPNVTYLPQITCSIFVDWAMLAMYNKPLFIVGVVFYTPPAKDGIHKLVTKYCIYRIHSTPPHNTVACMRCAVINFVQFESPATYSKYKCVCQVLPGWVAWKWMLEKWWGSKLKKVPLVCHFIRHCGVQCFCLSGWFSESVIQEFDTRAQQ